MPPRKDKRYFAKLLKQGLTQHTTSSRSTTTRHHITASGQTTREVPRNSVPKPSKQITVEPLLDAPQDEEASGVTGDGTEDPVNGVHDPETLKEEQTQVSTYTLIVHKLI
jgi:hypothetical protein